jgi:protoheme IX farnesyltransferase
MIGWAAVTGAVSIESIVLFTLIFLWTPPHFWALALYKNEDYKKAGVPMLPVVAGADATRRQIFIYTLLLTPFVAAPYVMGFAGVFYAAGAAVLHTLFIISAWRVLRDDTMRSARSMFAFSIFYLFALFALMMVP